MLHWEYGSPKINTPRKHCSESIPSIGPHTLCSRTLGAAPPLDEADDSVSGVYFSLFYHDANIRVRGHPRCKFEAFRSFLAIQRCFDVVAADQIRHYRLDLVRCKETSRAVMIPMAKIYGVCRTCDGELELVGIAFWRFSILRTGSYGTHRDSLRYSDQVPSDSQPQQYGRLV